MDVVRMHAFAGCNRVANALDWGSSGRVAYGAHNSVVIYDVEVSLHQSRGVQSSQSSGCEVFSSEVPSLIPWALWCRRPRLWRS